MSNLASMLRGGVLVVAALLGGGEVRAEATGAWAEIAVDDLDAMAAAIGAIHAGPVDDENPQFRTALAEGLARARAAARTADDFQDYRRIMMRFANGFRDGHLNIRWRVDVRHYEWPGFLPRLDADGTVRVGVSETDAVAPGEVVHACDGRALGDIFDERVAPILWNADIPHERNYLFSYVLLTEAFEASDRFASCDVGEGADRREIDLQWRLIGRTPALERRWEAVGLVEGELGLHRHGDIWMLSLPTFNYWSSDSIDEYRELLEEVRRRSNEIRSAAAFVIDVRGNTGGVSVWGNRMAGALWGEAWRDAIEARLEDGVAEDWRVSQPTIDHLTTLASRLARDDPSTASDIAELRDAMVEARGRGEVLLRRGGEDRDFRLPETGSPFSGPVYFLTDYVCSSACLDFADLVLRLPGVTHIGQPTSGDAVYIDNTEVNLPSGLATLSLSMKVWRNRVRGNNAYYSPAHDWPGGPMTDDAIVAWARRLAAAE